MKRTRRGFIYTSKKPRLLGPRAPGGRATQVTGMAISNESRWRHYDRYDDRRDFSIEGQQPRRRTYEQRERDRLRDDYSPIDLSTYLTQFERSARPLPPTDVQLKETLEALRAHLQRSLEVPAHVRSKWITMLEGLEIESLDGVKNAIERIAVEQQDVNVTYLPRWKLVREMQFATEMINIKQHLDWAKTIVDQIIDQKRGQTNPTN